MTTTYALDGTEIRTLEDFWRVIGEAINGPGGYFGRNLDAFADCLQGGFGAPEDDDYVLPSAPISPRRGRDAERPSSTGWSGSSRGVLLAS